MRKVAIISTVLFIACLSFFLFKEKQEEQKAVMLSEHWAKERRPLQVKKTKLEQELENLEREYQNVTQPKGTTQLIFADCNEQVYSICYPILKKLGYTGVVVWSKELYPGAAGCMSVEQFEELMKDGWKICIQWEEQMATQKWWEQLQKQMQELKAEKATMIYFPKGCYSTKVDSQLKAMGFNIVICEENDNGNPLQEFYEEEIWRLGAIGSMTAKPKVWLKEAVARKANIAYLVGFSVQEHRYNGTSFRNMLETFRDYEQSGDLIVCNPEEAREYYQQRETGISPEVEATYQQAKAMLESKIKEVKEQLKEIDAQYQ